MIWTEQERRWNGGRILDLGRSGLSQKKGGTAVEQGKNGGRIYGGTAVEQGRNGGDEG